MRKLSLFIAIFLLPLTASAYFDRDLYFGLQADSDVTALQEFLTEQGVYSGPITSNYFSLTLKGVKGYQTSKGISPTGYFGPLTRAAANDSLKNMTDESGAVISPATTPPKTTEDVVAKLMEQLNALLAQVQILQTQQAELEKQSQTLASTTAALGAIQTEQTKQTETLGQIQANTTPAQPDAKTLAKQALNQEYSLKVQAIGDKERAIDRLTTPQSNLEEILRSYGYASSTPSFASFVDTDFEREFVTNLYRRLDQVHEYVAKSKSALAFASEFATEELKKLEQQKDELWAEMRQKISAL